MPLPHFIENSVPRSTERNQQFPVFRFKVIGWASGMGELFQHVCSRLYGIEGFLCRLRVALRQKGMHTDKPCQRIIRPVHYI